MLSEQEVKEEETYNYRQETETKIVTHRICSLISIEYFDLSKIHHRKRLICELSNLSKAQKY